MKKFILFSSLGLLLLSCKKDQSSIHGVVTYVDTLGNSHIADGADIYLYKEVVGGDYEMTQVTTADGNYTFHDIEDGLHVVYGQITVNSITYTGQFPNALLCEKDAVQEADFVLE